jgi:DNA methylase
MSTQKLIQNSRYALINCDAFEWLLRRRAKSIHAVVTDPPFGILEYTPEQLSKRKNGHGGIWRLPQAFDGHKRNPVPRFTVLGAADYSRIEAFHTNLATLLRSVLVPGGHVMIASQTLVSHLVIRAFVSKDFEMRGQIARIVRTLRGGDRPKGGHDKYHFLSVTPRCCWEPWLIFRKPCEGRVIDNLAKWGTGALRRPESSKPFHDLIWSSPARGWERKVAPHPSLKPQAFIRQLVWASLPLGKGVVVDPFMGSGSAIAAAESVGLRSVGIEVDPDYFKLAARAVPVLSRWQPPSNGNGRPDHDPQRM